MKKYSALIIFAMFTTFGCIDTKAQTAGNEDKITNYLADISATPVSAGSLVGLSGSAISNIQSAQDLTLALSPLSSGSGQGGFGLAITPARTTIFPMSGKTYSENLSMRLIGATTISYAENTSTISGASYKKSAASIDTTYYLVSEQDPIIMAASLFPTCQKRKEMDDQEIPNFINNHDMTQEDNKAKIEKMRSQAVAAWATCLKSAANSADWNASKLSLSIGAGWIKPTATAGASQSLGRDIVLGSIFKSGQDGATYITVRRATGEIDLNTLAGTPTFSSHTLAAIRFTQGVANDSTLRFLAEVSSANTQTSTITASNDVFKYAVGFDKKLTEGVWAEFRLGRNRTADGLATQTTSLLNLNWSPTSTLPVSSKAP